MSALFQRRHMERLALGVRRIQRDDVRCMVAAALSDILSQENNEFDRRRFLTACGGIQTEIPLVGD